MLILYVLETDKGEHKPSTWLFFASGGLEFTVQNMEVELP